MKQKTNINKDIEKIYYIREINEEKTNENIGEIETITKAIRNRRQSNKKYDDLSLRRSEIKYSIIHYESGKLQLKDRMTDFEGLKNITAIKIKRTM